MAGVEPSVLAPRRPRKSHTAAVAAATVREGVGGASALLVPPISDLGEPFGLKPRLLRSAATTTPTFLILLILILRLVPGPGPGRKRGTMLLLIGIVTTR